VSSWVVFWKYFTVAQKAGLSMAQSEGYGISCILATIVAAETAVVYSG
jgi:hypothetical protein